LCRTDKGYLYQFIPKEYEYLTKTNKIKYKDINIKTAYLINIMHELILKYYFTNDVYHNLWSIILKKKYGKYYNYYIMYLLEYDFMLLVSSYYAGKKAKTYKLNITSLDVIRTKIRDKVILKKQKKEYLFRSFTAIQESPIDMELRKILIDDLYHIDIKYNSSLKWLNEQKTDKTIELNKYFKNLNSIDGINTGYIFFKFDAFGRLHTNYTVLKKYIRQNHLTIDGEEISEIDLPNSQPYFFGVYLKNEIGEEYFSNEIKNFLEVVKNGLIYDQILEKYPTVLKNRKEAKLLMYKVLFGKNVDKQLENRIFQKLYPTVYDYIKEYKYLSDDYKSLSHKLQLIESDFIYNKVVKTIKKEFPYIRLFTIHDSICFPTKYKEEVNMVFKMFLKELL
jgi:hypothetical protein